MTEMNRKEVMNELYDSTLITLGTVGIGMITRRAFSDGLSIDKNGKRKKYKIFWKIQKR